MKVFKYEIMKLIENVESRPCLWDKTLESNKDRMLKKIAWEEIFNNLEERFDEMNDQEKLEVGAAIQNKWTNIRDAFVRSLRPKPGMHGKPQVRYSFHNQLLFLLKVLPENKQYVALKADTSQFYNYERLNDENRGSKVVSKEEVLSRSSLEEYVEEPSPKKQRAELSISYDEPPFDFVDSSDVRVDGSGRLMNEDEAFFASLLPSVVKYDEDEKLEFRMDVLALMKKIRDNRKRRRENIDD